MVHVALGDVEVKLARDMLSIKGLLQGACRGSCIPGPGGSVVGEPAPHGEQGDNLTGHRIKENVIRHLIGQVGGQGSSQCKVSRQRCGIWWGAD